MKIFAKHKRLNREFPVQEINFVSKRVKCEGLVEAGVCIICLANEPCGFPIFRFDDVDFRVDMEDKK